jgi:nitrosocyanin
MRRAARVALSITLAAIVGVALSACGGTQTEHRTINAAAVSGKPGFAPQTITVDKRNRVEIKVGNSTDKTHGFSIEGYGIHEEVQPGQPIDVKFTANNAGTYKVYCQLHPAHQTATLIVR